MTKTRIHSGASPEEIAADVSALVDFQEEGLSLPDLNELIETKLVPHFVRYDHPGFQSLYNFKVDPGAALGARVALEHNQGVTNYQVSPGGVMLEELCGQALARLFGLAPEAGAAFMYSGTYANQQALYLALSRKAEELGIDLASDGLAAFSGRKPLALVASSEAHFSLRQCLRMMGLGERALKTVPVDPARRMDPGLLEKTLDELSRTHEVFCVTATAGTSSTGSVDPVGRVLELCRGRNIWTHVDAAYGLAYSLLPDKAGLFSGIEAADSVAWDPHKQSGTPIPSSILFVRRARDLDRMAVFSGYYNRPNDPRPNPGLKSPPSTRPLTALPLAATIRQAGLAGFRKKLAHHLDVVTQAADHARKSPDLELMHDPDLGILCLRLVPAGFPENRLCDLQEYLYERTAAEGERSVSLTSIDGKKAIRFLILSGKATGPGVIETLNYLRAMARDFKP